MKITPPPKTKNKGYALAMARWNKETPNSDYFRKIAKIRWKQWRESKNLDSTSHLKARRGLQTPPR